jgi:hypothetical protein
MGGRGPTIWTPRLGRAGGARPGIAPLRRLNLGWRRLTWDGAVSTWDCAAAAAWPCTRPPLRPARPPGLPAAVLGCCCAAPQRLPPRLGWARLPLHRCLSGCCAVGRMVCYSELGPATLVRRRQPVRRGANDKPATTSGWRVKQETGWWPKGGDAVVHRRRGNAVRSSLRWLEKRKGGRSAKRGGWVTGAKRCSWIHAALGGPRGCCALGGREEGGQGHTCTAVRHARCRLDRCGGSPRPGFKTAAGWVRREQPPLTRRLW